MHDLVIMYGYYARERELVESHYYCLLRDNPGVPVVPLVYNAPIWIEGTIDVYPLDNVWLKEDEFPAEWTMGVSHQHAFMWHHSEQVFLRYLRSPHRLEASRYLFLEWDTFSDKMSCREFFARIWDAPIGGARVWTKNTLPVWNWWYAELLDKAGDKARGITPIGGTLLSREVALFLANTPFPNWLKPAFVEVGYPTWTAMNGFEPQELGPPNNLKFGVCGDPISYSTDRGIYHPIKYFVQATPKPEEVRTRLAALQQSNS